MAKRPRTPHPRRTPGKPPELPPTELELSPSERRALEQLAGPDSYDGSLQLRAQIVLDWAAGKTGEQSAAERKTSRRTVTKWRTRFRDGGVEALSDRPRPGAPRSIAESKIAEFIRLQNTPPPRGKRRWTTRMLAKRTGLSQSTVVRLVRDYAEGRV